MNQLDTLSGRELLQALRAACAELPEVDEVVDGFGHTTFKVNRKSFIIAGMGDAGDALSIKSDPMTQAVLVRREPYSRTPYIGQHGWVTVSRPLEQEWGEIQELIRNAYLLAAPKRLARQVRPT
jgi:predicted DNA-binding protein (MmcQ/YjbR family)